MKILQIASGSKGNCTFIELDNKKILIDCGISKKRIQESLKEYNHKLSEIDYIFITHEHTDHVAGIVPIFNATTANFYMTKGTYEGLNKRAHDVMNKNRVKIIQSGISLAFKNIIITPFDIFHDANEPVGYIFSCREKKFVYITDTGYVHKSFLNNLKNADAYILESNHDPEILMSSDRPYNLKLRILSDHGHLSNEDSAYIASEIIGDRTKYIFLAHISDECNVPDLAYETFIKVFKNKNVDLKNTSLLLCSQKPLKEIEV